MKRAAVGGAPQSRCLAQLAITISRDGERVTFDVRDMTRAQYELRTTATVPLAEARSMLAAFGAGARSGLDETLATLREQLS